MHEPGWAVAWRKTPPKVYHLPHKPPMKSMSKLIHVRVKLRASVAPAECNGNIVLETRQSGVSFAICEPERGTDGFTGEIGGVNCR